LRACELYVLAGLEGLKLRDKECLVSILEHSGCRHEWGLGKLDREALLRLMSHDLDGSRLLLYACFLGVELDAAGYLLKNLLVLDEDRRNEGSSLLIWWLLPAQGIDAPLSVFGK